MLQPYVIKMPQLSDTMTEGVVVSWEKNIGDKISRGDIVATIETDKAIMDVEVFREGYLSGPSAMVNSVVAVGDPIAYLVNTVEEVQDGEESVVPTTTHSSKTPAPAVASSSIANAGMPADDQPDGVVHVIKMPQLSDTMTEGVVVSWQKEIGDKIERGDVVAQIETDKAIMDVEVFREGYLSGPLTAVDAVVPVGDPIGYLVEKAEQAQATTAVARSGTLDIVNSPSHQDPRHRAAVAHPTPGQKLYETHVINSTAQPAPRPENRHATPYARKLAGIFHINLNTVKASGPDGVIVAQDVKRAQPVARPSEVIEPTSPYAMPQVQVPGAGRPMTAMERAVSHSMTASLTMPTFRVMLPAKPEALIKAAKKHNLSVTVAIAKACALAIKKHPTINWCYQPVDKLVERDYVDVGVAVAADDGGLVVPVLRRCETRSLEELQSNWAEMVERARKRRLKPEEFTNPTFMVSNMGMFGIKYFDAIPTPGTAAILAISGVGPDGMPLTITADHRVVNGVEVAVFLTTLKGIIEQPDSWMGTSEAAIPEGNWDYDVVVIGGGPGGEDCARELAEHGVKVALINDAPLPGGECLWRGCIPSKAWRAAADRMRDRANDSYLGVQGTDKATLDFAKLEQTRRRVLETRGEMALKTDTGVKIKMIQGYASFESDHRLFIDTSGNSQERFIRPLKGDGSKGESISFGCAVIAAGAPPFVPPIPGAIKGLEEGGGVLTSDTVWNLTSVPKSIVVIGGGAIGMEMAQIFRDFGSQVVLLEARERILFEVEAEIAKNLTTLLAEESNLVIHTSAKVKEVKGVTGDMLVAYEDSAGAMHSVGCEVVIMATGKRPVLEPLRLQNAGVIAENSAIKIDGKCRTNLAHIFAVGDVNGGYMLAHTAAQQGRVAAATILGEDRSYNQDKDCGVIFTRPQAAFVGLSVEQAKAQGIDAVEVKVPMSIDAKAMITNETHGLIKMVADKSSQRIIGVHFLADHADTLIGEAVMMVSGNMTLKQVAEAIHPHPTQTELFGDMARRLLSRLRRTQKVK